LIKVIKTFRDAITIPSNSPSVYHQLNITFISHPSRPTLALFSHYSNLLLAILVLNCNCTLNWIEIASHIFFIFLSEFFPFPELFGHHLKAICIVPEIAICIKIIKLPVDYYVFPSFFYTQLVKPLSLIQPEFSPCYWNF
jgi:hypothetical protein